MLRFASSGMAGPAAMPGCPKTRSPKKERARVHDASTHQGIRPLRQLTAPQKNGLPNLSQSWKKPHSLFDRILWIWMKGRALESFDKSKRTTELPANDPFERKFPVWARIPSLRKLGIGDKRLEKSTQFENREIEKIVHD